MRLGSNPLKSATITPPARVVVLVITHLPEIESEYHRGRLEVIKHSLYTASQNTGVKDFELWIWDNGSCRNLTDWLTAWNDDTVIISRNIGKTNALKSVMRMLPAGTILAYGDDDIEYFPNWLAPQIEILDTYIEVGTVTGWPVRVTGKWGTNTTRKMFSILEQQGDYRTKVEQGRFIPEEWERDYCESVGRDWEGYKSVTWGVSDYRITYKGVQAYAMSQHAQFVCYPERVEPLIPWTDRAMADEIAFDKAVDEDGLLRLATVERYTRHLGNVLEERA